MPNIVANLFKLLLGLGAVLLVVVVNWGLYVTNFINVDTALELLNTEKRPAVHAPAVGMVLAAVAPDSTIANWLALVVASGMFLGAFFAFHFAYKIAYLLIDARGYRRAGQPDLSAAAHDLVIRDLVILVPLVLMMIPLIRGDLFLFSYARTAAAMDIDDPTRAVQQITVWGEPLEGPEVAAAMWFAKVLGPEMYLALSLLTPALLEISMLKAAQTWNRIWAALMTFAQPQQAEAAAAVEAPRQHFGYDADGMPVYDPAAPIAYDVNQQPVAAEPPAAQPSPSRESAPAAEPAVTQFPAGEERVPVIGGRPGETVALTQALQQPGAYHVDRATRRVYQRAYWDALDADTNSTTNKPAEAA